MARPCRSRTALPSACGPSVSLVTKWQNILSELNLWTTSGRCEAEREAIGKTRAMHGTLAFEAATVAAVPHLAGTGTKSDIEPLSRTRARGFLSRIYRA